MNLKVLVCHGKSGSCVLNQDRPRITSSSGEDVKIYFMVVTGTGLVFTNFYKR